VASSGDPSGGASTVIEVSVIIVTHNPPPELLDAALNSVERQTLSPGEFEVIVVDNASSPPLSEAAFEHRTPRPRIVGEPNVGILSARRAGIRAAAGELLVFVDDDNQISPDYLEQALRIARANPKIGAFGGICEPLFDRPIAKWKTALLPYLGIRDHGSDVITSKCGDWGKWDPIGAGMAIRREIGLRFADFVESHPEVSRLGRSGKSRSGKSMMSGDDTLISRVAWMMNYSCSYQPSLRLSHYMKPGRLAATSLIRTLVGHGRSYIVLEQILGRANGKLTWRAPVSLFFIFWLRVGKKGLRAGSIEWFWDVGRILELFSGRQSAQRMRCAR
jgi:glycosyltransferase involved in cell wall biosynthesis